MGIKKIARLIKDKIKEHEKETGNKTNAIIEKKINDYKGKWVVFDANLVLYKIILAIMDSPTGNIVNSRGKIVSHIHALFFKVVSLIHNGIKPIFVFDGKPPKLKEEILKDRRKIKEKAIELLENKDYDDSSEEEKKKLERKAFTVRRSHVEECMVLLNLMGVPYIQAIEEADPQCVAFTLSKKYNIYAVASEDADILTFGSPILLRDFSNKKKIKEFNLSNILKLLKIDYDQYVNLSVLLGSDYLKNTIFGLGPENALKLIKKYKTLEKIVDHVKNNNKFKVPDNYLEDVQKAKDLFINPVVYNVDEIDIKLRPPKVKELFEFIISENEIMERKQLTKNINKLVGGYKRFREPINKKIIVKA